MALIVHIACRSTDVEVMSDHLWSLGVMGIEEVNQSGDQVILRTTLGQDRLESEQRLSTLRSHISADLHFEFSFHHVDDAISDTWRAFAQPVQIGADILVIPAWLPEPNPDECVGSRIIRIEPGATFGLGDHPTTRASLQLMRHYVRPKSKVLDVGCGSGILGIAAVCFGAESAFGIDINPASESISRANAAINGVSDHWMVTMGNLDDVLTEELLRNNPDGFEIIVANILAPVLISLAPYFLRLLASDGTLIISGVLEGKFDHVSAALQPLQVTEQCDLEGWSAVAFVHETKASISSR